MKKFDKFVEDLQEEKQLEENAVRFAALEAMKNVQATLAGISLLDVLGVMKPDNPLKADVLAMETQLHDLSAGIGQFIADNIADVETEEQEAGEEPAEEEPEPEEKPKEEKPKKEEKKPAKKKKEDEDVDEPEVKGDAPKEQSQEDEDDK